MVTRIFSIFFVSLLATAGVSWLIALACERAQKTPTVQTQTSERYSGVFMPDGVRKVSQLDSTASVVRLLVPASTNEAFHQQDAQPAPVSTTYWNDKPNLIEKNGQVGKAM